MPTTPDSTKTPSVGTRSLRPLVISLVLFVTVATGVVFGAKVVDHNQEEQLRMTGRVTLSQVRDRLGQYMAARFGLLDALATELSTEETLEEADFVRRAHVIHGRISGFQAINWIDDRGVIRWVWPEQANRAAVGRDVHDHAKSAVAIEAARDGSARATGPITLFQGGLGVAVYVPVVRGGRVVGFVNGVFRVQDVVADCLGSELVPHFLLEISDADGAVIETPAEPPASWLREYSATSQLPVLNRTWTLRLSPVEELAKDLLSNGDDVAMVIGILLAAGLALLLARLLWRQQELQDTKQLYQSVVEDSRFGVVIHRDGVALFANGAVSDLTGYGHDEMPSLNVFDLIAPHDRARAAQVAAARVKGLYAPPYHEVGLIRRDGSARHVQVGGSVIHYGGEPASVITILDITERKRAEASLRLSEERHRELVERAPLGIAAVSRDGRVTTGNPSLVVLLGAPGLEQVMEDSFDAASFYAKLEGAQEIWTRCFVGREAGTAEFTWTTPWDRRLEARLHFAPIHEASGAVTSMLAMIEDVTEVNRAERNRKELEAQLLQAQKMEAVGTLAGGIAHDFNNLLTAILGGVELARMDLGEDSDASKSLHHAQYAAERAAELTSQLLTLSRKQQPELGSIRVNEVVVQTASLLQRSVGRNIAVVEETVADLPSVLGNVSHLGQALLNLGINARDAMPDGGTLTLTTGLVSVVAEDIPPQASADPGLFVEIVVQDTGTGMDRETIDHIFEPFFTTKEPGKGTGLGLSMVYTCLKAHHGWVTVSSEEGQGTRFGLLIPCEVRNRTLRTPCSVTMD